MKLYKTTITVWTKENPELRGMNAYDFGAAVHNGDAYCDRIYGIETVLVETRDETGGWEAAEFFGEDK